MRRVMWPGQGWAGDLALPQGAAGLPSATTAGKVVTTAGPFGAFDKKDCNISNQATYAGHTAVTTTTAGTHDTDLSTTTANQNVATTTNSQVFSSEPKPTLQETSSR